MPLPIKSHNSPTEDVSSVQNRHAILEARARILAQPPAREPELGSRFDALQFALGGERYALAAEFIREVLPLKDFSPIPCTPAFVVGMMNVRGQILTLINLCPLLDLPRHAISDLNQVIVLRGGQAEFGVLADAIVGMRSVGAAELQTAIPSSRGLRADVLRGITPDCLIVLDALKLLAHPEMIVRDEGHA